MTPVKSTRTAALLLMLVGGASLLAAACGNDPTPTPLPISTETPVPSVTPIRTPTSVVSAFPTPTPRPTNTRIPATSTATVRPLNTGTAVATRTRRPLPSATRIPTSTVVPSATPTTVPTSSPTPTLTATATPIPPTVTPTPTRMPTVTPTAVRTFALRINGRQIIGDSFEDSSGTVTIQPSPSPLTGSYPAGTRVFLTATEHALSAFVGWGGDCNGTAFCSLLMPDDRAVTAEFRRTFALSVNGNQQSPTLVNAANGRISIFPEGNAQGNRYIDGTQVILNAESDANFAFHSWGSDCGGTTTRCSLTMDSNKTITTAFVPTFALTVETIRVEGDTLALPLGSVRVSPPPNAANSRYRSGTTVTLSLDPDPNVVLLSWGGDCPNTGMSCVLTVNSDRSANVSLVKSFALDVSVVGLGSVRVAPPSNAPDERYLDGSQVTLTGVPTGEAMFESWGSECTGTAECVVTMNSDRSITATFQQTYTLIMNGIQVVDPPGRFVSLPRGGVSVDPLPDLPGGRYKAGTPVRLATVPNFGIVLTKWQGDCVGTNRICNVVIDDVTRVEAIFSSGQSEPYAINVNGNKVTSDIHQMELGVINVSRSPNAGNSSYRNGTEITLSARPITDFRLASWGGACSGTGDCTLTMDGEKDVLAAFEPIDAGFPPATAGRVLFTSTRDGNQEIYVMDANGANEQRLTIEPAEDSSPSWSPDGKTILFQSNRNGKTEIWVMAADGSNQSRLMETPTQDSEPAWSRDGTKIAFVRQVSNVGEVYIADADGTNTHRLTSSSFSEGNLSPTWGPNDVFLFYASKATGNWEIWRMEPETGINKFQVTRNGGNKGNPTFTADGFVLFDWDIDGKRDIYRMQSDGREVFNLTNSPTTTDEAPHAEPGENYIVFQRTLAGEDANSREVYVMKWNGSEQRRLTDNAFDDAAPAWHLIENS